jgi:ATP-dependent Clp protease protease subunit
MTRLISAHTGKPEETVRADSQRDRWFSAAEARDYGLVDHILERVDDIRPDVVSRAAGL